MTDKELCQTCGDQPAEWTWHDGMWPGGRYCADCIREKLDPERKAPEYRDAITTAESVTTLGDRGAAVIPAGAHPLDSQFPVVRTQEALDEVLDR